MTTIIGLTGSFGSGCTYLAEEFIVKKGYKRISLSDILRAEFEKEHPDEDPTRQLLQDYGNKKRQEEDSDFLAKKAAKIIAEEDFDKVIIDSIRNPNEIDFLKKEYSEFFLFSVFANYEVRWNRVKNLDEYDGNQKKFDFDDERDRDEDLEYGQRVIDCCEKSDIVISNNKDVNEGSGDYNDLNDRIKYYIDLVEHNIKFEPRDIETLMAMAYANSLRSKCLKRKVGAVIIDAYGNLFSSGLNNTPVSVRPCMTEYGKCYRDQLRTEFSSCIKNCVEDEDCRDKILEKFKGFKILDYCRALHAEESAILNATTTGSSSALMGATLFTTTYPCNLCANKIVKVGITKIVYTEPYPMVEAQKILNKEDVVQIPFEGVSFNGYFRVGGN